VFLFGSVWIRIRIELICWIRIQVNPDPQPWGTGLIFERDTTNYSGTLVENVKKVKNQPNLIYSPQEMAPCVTRPNNVSVD
jgi:hypothetical protein